MTFTFLSILFCISQIFNSKYVFCCNQENIILSDLKNNLSGKKYHLSSLSLHTQDLRYVRGILGIPLSNTEVQVGWLTHLFYLCMLPCPRYEALQGTDTTKDTSLPTDNIYDAVLGIWGQDEYIVWSNYGMLSSYYKRMSYVHTRKDYWLSPVMLKENILEYCL